MKQDIVFPLVFLVLFTKLFPKQFHEGNIIETAIMTIIDDELQELKKCCENILPDSKLVACVPAMVRVELKKSDFKTMAICLTYPSNYPTHHILVEIKSKKLSRKLLDGLEKVAETEAKKYIGKPHIIFILKMINQFFEDNPLVF